MPFPTDVQTIIDEAIAEVLEASMPRLRAEMVRHATEALQQAAATAEDSPSDLLNSAVTAIQEGSSQADILRRLLEGTTGFAGRAALFVVKAKSISGWQAQGFADNDGVKTLALDASTGLIAQAIQTRALVSGPAKDFDEGFLGKLGAPAGENCVVLPLVVKLKVAAIVYADAGVEAGGTLDAPALDLLTRVTALWIELVTLRKTGVEEAHPAASEPAAPPEPIAAAEPAVAPQPEPMAPADAEVHKKARRFAKLLVDEIRLYNQAKVTEGRKEKDLYDRLRDDIEKSRATYDKRYSATTAASADYFSEELIRVLADNDITLMGGSFPHN
jgi:hypothetical protein